MTRLVYSKNSSFKLLNNIIHYGIFSDATTIIIDKFLETDREPELRYRSYAVLSQPIKLSDEQVAELWEKLIKLSGLNENGQGQFVFQLVDMVVGCRVELLSGRDTQSMLIHLELGQAVWKTWSELGLANAIGDDILDQLVAQKGLVFLVGSSGLSALAYSLMSQLDSVQVSVACLESPTLYRHQHYSQLNWHAGLGYSYQRAFERLAAQDSDIYFVDNFQALDYQFLGRLASSKLVIVAINDCDDIAQALIKVSEADRSLLAVTKLMILRKNIAQNCPRCSQLSDLPAELISQLAQVTGLEPQALRQEKFYQATGCADCGFSGYRDQTALFDILMPNRELITALMAQGFTKQTISLINDALSLNALESAYSKATQGLVNPKEIINNFL